jgi:short-subunit dehydrogenase involved in D-alanine esterification of teichoic acids
MTSLGHWKDLSAQHASIINMTNGLSFAASKYLCIFNQFKAVYSAGKKQIETKLG